MDRSGFRGTISQIAVVNFTETLKEKEEENEAKNKPLLQSHSHAHSTSLPRIGIECQEREGKKEKKSSI